MLDGVTGTGELRSERPVSLDSGLCARYRCSRSSCVACAAVCSLPGVIRLSDEGIDVTEACVGCGACVSACPNGAIRAREDDQLIVEKIDKRVTAGKPFRIACSRAKGRLDLVVPCLSRLTEGLMLEPIRRGASRVELLDPGCSSCGLGKAAVQWPRVLDWARALGDAAGAGTDRIVRVDGDAAGPAETKATSRPAGSRRALFESIAAKLAQPAPRDATDAVDSLPDASRPFSEAVKQRHDNFKRSHLLEVLRGLSAGVATSTVVLTAGVPLTQVQINQRCVGCNVCELLCPVGALEHREAEGRYRLDFQSALCTGCGVCRDSCFHGAVGFRETVDLAALIEPRAAILVSASRRICQLCHEPYLGDETDTCPLCLTNDRRRQAIVRRFLFGGNHGDRP